MKALKLYLTSFNRYRRSKGFGVHSPFAYYFIVRVLREKLSYYAYPEIDRAAEAGRSISKVAARRLFRIANYFQPAAIFVAGAWDTGTVTALKAACGSVPVKTIDGGCMTDSGVGQGSAMLYIGTAGDADEDALKRLACSILEAGGTVVVNYMASSVANRAIFKAVDASMKSGMTFSNGVMAVMAGRHELPRQKYSLWF